MPQPQWATGGPDLFDKPTTSMEIIGRGDDARKSKTFIKDQELATLLGFIRGHTRRLFEVFRRLHSNHFNIEVEEESEDENGVVTKTKKIIPHVLIDSEIRDLYPVVREWERMHQEQVDHYASIGGFSVNAASGNNREGDPGEGGRKDSSAGADRRSKTGASKVNGTEAKWR